MVTIAREACVKCGSCVAVCPNGVFEQTAAGVEVIHGASCMTCGHCMAACPAMAVGMPEYSYVDCPPLPARPLNQAALEDIFRSRRTTRRYRPEPAPREALSQVVAMAAAAPMGLPPTDVEVMVVTDREMLDTLAPVAFTRMRQLRAMLRVPLLGPLVRAGLGREVMATIEQHFLPLFDAFERQYRETGVDPITWGAPALLLFHGPRGLCTRENALLALTYAMLAAETRDLGTCVNGIIQNMVDRDRALRECFGLPAGHRVYGALLLGYPADTPYRRSLLRAFKRVEWK